MLTPIDSKPLRWQKTRYSPLTRQLDVFTACGSFMFFLWWDKTLAHQTNKQKQKRAIWLVKTLLELGPTFIKIGQALSTRADILPLEYVEELEKLQDQVPPFSTDEAVAIIEAELGHSLFTLYRDFDEQPLAAASLGQVHKARLHTGEDVIVKVQRPGLKELFDLDVQAVRRIIQFCQRHFSWSKLYNLDELYNEFFMILYQEIDYIKEGKNAERFKDNFKNYPGILVPKVYWKYTSHKILTMQYLPGIKADDRDQLIAYGIDVKRLNQLGICCYLKQILQDGFFQADPHPGNIAVSVDGNLIFYDFGMMAEVKALAKDQMIKTFFAVLKKDTDVVLNTLVDIGLIEPVSDMKPVRKMVKFLLEEFTEKPVDFQMFNQIKEEIYIMFEQQPFRLPAQMMFILKSLTTLDGLARSLDPKYSLVACAEPFVKSLTISQGRGNLVGELAKQARDFIKFRLQQPSKSEILIRRLEERLEDGELQIRVRSLESDRALRRINLAIKTLIYICWTGFTLIAGAILLIGNYQGWAVFILVLSLFGLWMSVRSLFNLAIRETVRSNCGKLKGLWQFLLVS